MKFTDLIEFLKMVKDAEKGMPAGRFWFLAAIAATASGGWVAYAAAKLIEVMK